MDKQYTTDAINIKSYPLNDFDNILLMYSKSAGLIKCIAKGAKKPKSKLGARAQVLFANKLMLNKGKTFDKITQAQGLNTFSKLREDFDKLSYGLYCADFISIFCADTEEEAEIIYDIFYKTLENIANSKDKKEILLQTLKFQLHILEELGWGIDFRTCSCCGAEIEEYSYFSNEEKGNFCTCCAKSNIKVQKIPKKLIEFLSTLKEVAMDEKAQYDELADLNTVNICFQFIKKYSEKISGRVQKFSDFNLIAS